MSFPAITSYIKLSALWKACTLDNAVTAPNLVQSGLGIGLLVDAGDESAASGGLKPPTTTVSPRPPPATPPTQSTPRDRFRPGTPSPNTSPRTVSPHSGRDADAPPQCPTLTNST